MLPTWLLVSTRAVHIVAGVAWAGSLFFFVFMVEPSSRALGPAAAPFMQELIGKRKVVHVILWSAGITIAAGGLLYWHDWQAVGSLSDWVGSGFGLGLTVGGIAALSAFLIGIFGTRPYVARLMALGKRAAEGGGPPPPELQQQIAMVQTRLRILARTGLALLTFTIIAMSTARYW